MVIIDEEHENTFKQNDPSPRYHGRDVAMVLANQQNAKVLLGTATPSLESYYNCSNNKFGLVELKDRYKEMKMPGIELVDMKKEAKQKTMQSHFSSKMMEAISESLEKERTNYLVSKPKRIQPIVVLRGLFLDSRMYAM